MQLHHQICRGSVTLPPRQLSGVTVQRRQLTTASAAKTEASSAESVKQEISRLSGTLYGHDLSDDTRRLIAAAVDQLQSLGPKPQPNVQKLAGTQWQLLYTTSQGTSSGKVGPFITKVRQASVSVAAGCCLAAFIWHGATLRRTSVGSQVLVAAATATC